MTKEESLELMKWLILQLRDNGQKLKDDPMLMADWVAKQKHLETSVKALNSCDALWINDNYGVWYKKEIEPIIPAILKKS